MDVEIDEVYNKIILERNGREILAKLMDDDNAWVRLYVAAASKDIYPEKAKATFIELAQEMS
jgi:3-methyladenine DNA glycosylase AlkC